MTVLLNSTCDLSKHKATYYKKIKQTNCNFATATNQLQTN